MRRRTRAHPMEVLLSRHSALGSLETLVSSPYGCSREFLLSIFDLMRTRLPHLDDWKLLTGRDARHLRQAIRAIKACAALIESFNSSSFGFHLVVNEISRFRGLPGDLCAYARELELTKMTLGPKKKRALHMQKYCLVKHVILKTGRPCDHEVSVLIAAASGNDSYDTASHKQWRYKWFDYFDRRAREADQLADRPR